MKNYVLELSAEELNALIRAIEFGHLEITRQMKKLSQHDIDIKEDFWLVRYKANDIKRQLRALRGF